MKTSDKLIPAKVIYKYLDLMIGYEEEIINDPKMGDGLFKEYATICKKDYELMRGVIDDFVETFGIEEERIYNEYKR